MVPMLTLLPGLLPQELPSQHYSWFITRVTSSKKSSSMPQISPVSVSITVTTNTYVVTFMSWFSPQINLSDSWLCVL